MPPTRATTGVPGASPAARVGNDLAGALDTEHVDAERPHAASHVRVGMVEPEGVDRDQDLSFQRSGIWEFTDLEHLGPAVSAQDDGTHCLS
jgi:hypothetical protein